MIIGFDASRAFAPNRTGTENYSYQLLKALARIDKKNQYFIYIRSGSVILKESSIEGSLANASITGTSPEILRFAQNDRDSWPKNFQFKVIKWPRLWTQGGLALAAFKDNLDILFVPAHTLPVIRRKGLKTVLTVHDLGSEYLPSMHQLKQRLYLSFMQKYQLQTAAKIIAVSKATKDDLIKRVGIEEDKITVVYEGFDQNLFKPTKGDTLVSSLMPYYLFVGTVQPRKNMERLIRAFAKFVGVGSSNPNTGRENPASTLVIAGSKGWMSDEIYRLPKQLGIEERVKFLGYVPEKELPALYSGAAAFVYPSLFEGFGLPVLEAQACGCPVLTSNISSMPEVAGKGAILVDPYSIDDIVKGMERVQGTGYRVQLIKAGFENIKKFSWEKCAAQTLQVLEGID